MWRNFSIVVFLFVLASTANALPAENFTNKITFTTTLTIEKSHSPLSPDFTLFVDENAPDQSFNLPRLNRICSSLFTNEIQTTPNYLLVIEFFKVKLTAGLFKNLANPPVHINWYEQLSHRSSSNRLAGWKDGNSLYTASITYHS
ncbi:hypothetical protein H4J55_13950 [Colwellia sp. MB3u-22]|jgi:hypothetical protein|uniref:hypothetical protein n=1 Tax=unclassified Colwellia TaxID=196834 RepID=UPI0015F7442B|nr:MULTISPECIES: hypothetical protein [unclassified Colwellia]MBA6237267.1 hypothetical protein [Colwellia sp. MB02u-11]MBA6300511.1 hypothetical protein [Colwellia sp. MB3u-22]